MSDTYDFNEIAKKADMQAYATELERTIQKAIEGWLSTKDPTVFLPSHAFDLIFSVFLRLSARMFIGQKAGSNEKYLDACKIVWCGECGCEECRRNLARLQSQL